MTVERAYDVVLWGATGFTGQLVAEYLSTAPSAHGLRWAIAARSRSKLESVAIKLRLPDTVGRIIADADDTASLGAIATQAHVVCSVVGPYSRYGSKLVAMCVAEQTHYCDLTGEVPWIREMIDAHHETAATRGTRIVHCCGFDSIPSDLGVLMMHRAMTARHLALHRVDTLVGEMKGTWSGGTVASLLGVLDRVKSDPAIRRLLGHPYALNPQDSQLGPDSADSHGIAYDKRLGTWTAPFLMAAINTRIVRRSNALLNFRYSRMFQYTERQSLGGRVHGMIRAMGVSGALFGFVTAASIAPLRPWLESKLPSPGDGPSREQRESGRYVLHLIAESTDTTPVRLYGRVAHDKDPGYGSTSTMLAEAAMCLARDELTSAGGVLTPAAAMGETLLNRLRVAGMTFDVVETPPI